MMPRLSNLFNVRMRTATGLLLTLVVLVGCQSPWAQPGDTARYAAPRALATHRPLLIDPRIGDRVHPADAWWRQRNDVGPTVIVGYRSPIIETTRIHSHHRRSVHGDRVRDHLHENVHRIRSLQIIR